MPSRLKTLAVVAVLAAGTSSVAMAQNYACPPGYAPYGGTCQPVPAPGYGYPNPVGGAAVGGATGGPVGAIVGGAIGTATGAVAGATGGYPAPAGCAPGYTMYNGACYPAR